MRVCVCVCVCVLCVVCVCERESLKDFATFQIKEKIPLMSHQLVLPTSKAFILNHGP